MRGATSVARAASGGPYPTLFLAWTAVYDYFRRWQPAVWGQLNEALNRADRLAADRAATPAPGCVGSQSVQRAPRIFAPRGVDGGECVNGRKGQLLADVEGRIFAGCVHAANGHDGAAATLGDKYGSQASFGYIGAQQQLGGEGR